MTPFEKNYNMKHLFYSSRINLGLYFKLSRWLSFFWHHPEADVFWYDVGPFAFYRVPQ